MKSHAITIAAGSYACCRNSTAVCCANATRGISGLPAKTGKPNDLEIGSVSGSYRQLSCGTRNGSLLLFLMPSDLTGEDVMQIRAVARTFTLAVCAMFLAGDLSAQTIRSAVSGTILDGGPGAGSIANTYDQAGLNTGYVSGVTDFDTYLASNPTHTINFFGSEWFSNLGTSSASVLYDLGSVFFIDALALWNEETSGIGVLDLYGSVNGTNFFALALGLTPPDNPLGESYGATRFNFTATDLRYVRMDMTDCPQGQEQNAYEGCAIGEVAFRDAVRDGSVVTPEPVTMILMGTGLAGVAVVRRRRRTDDIA